MNQSIAHIALVVKDYDEAIDFYTNKLHFSLVEDTYQPEQDKRWVVVAPPNSNGTTLLLARASKPEQEPFIGNVYCARIFMEDGARFNGKIEMATPTPLMVAPEPEEVDVEFAEAENLTA